jgi:hypothetical protein
MPTWHDPSGISYIDRYEDILRTTAAQKSEFSEYHIGCALLANTPADKRLQVSLKAQGWLSVSSSNGAILLIAPSN